MSAPVTQRRYKNGKTPTNTQTKARKLNKRKSANFKTAERLFGADFPAFGASLGTDYKPLTGVISKARRAQAIL